VSVWKNLEVFIKRIRHDFLHGSILVDDEMQTLQMSCNERFLVFQTKRGDCPVRTQHLYPDQWPYPTSDGILYFDLDENSSP
jgi:hypothetical protein